MATHLTPTETQSRLPFCCNPRYREPVPHRREPTRHRQQSLRTQCATADPLMPAGRQRATAADPSKLPGGQHRLAEASTPTLTHRNECRGRTPGQSEHILPNRRSSIVSAGVTYGAHINRSGRHSPRPARKWRDWFGGPEIAGKMHRLPQLCDGRLSAVRGEVTARSGLKICCP